MMYLFIIIILFIFSPISIKAETIVDNDVISFSYSNNAMVYVSFNEEYNLYIHENGTDTLLVSSESKINYPSISDDGKFIVFNSIAIKGEKRFCISILDGEKKLCNDIYLLDVDNKTLTNISYNFDGDSYIAAISGNGRYLVFESSSYNITKDHIFTCKTYKNNIDRACSNIYLYDLVNKSYILISKNTLSGIDDSMEPSINYDGSIVTFRSMSPFDNNVTKKCYSEFYKKYSYCSTIYMYKDNVIKMVSDGNNDAYNGYVSSWSNYISFDSYSTMGLFDSQYQNSTFLYDIDNDSYRAINISPNRKITNLGLNNDSKYNISITRATNIASSSTYMDNLVLTNIKTLKSSILSDGYHFDIIQAYIGADSKIYMLGDGKIIVKDLDSSAPSISSTKRLVLLKNRDYDLLKYIKVEDDLDQNVSIYISDDDNFDIGICGTYQITVRAIDSNLNESSFKYEVDVVEKDVEAPVFIGDKVYIVNINDKNFRLSQRIEITDNIDDDIKYVIENGTFDISKKGTYTLLLKAEDNSSNVSYHEVTLKVIDNDNGVSKILGGIVIVIMFVSFFLFLKKKK